MSITNVERSFGELLAAFGDLVVARTRTRGSCERDDHGARAALPGAGLFEIELHRHPARRPNDVWTEVTADGLGVEPHPEWSWRAIRGQLIDGPGYLANYALSAIMAAAVRSRIAEVRGPWFEGDPGWYAYVSEALFVAGASRTPADLLGAFVGGPLRAEPLLADLRRGGR